MPAFASRVSVSALPAADGFRISGALAGDRLAFVAAVGDVNGDGINDYLIGSSAADIAGQDGVGAIYLIFGGSDGRPRTFDVGTLNGVNGFAIPSPSQFAYQSESESWFAGGDINGDGFADLVIGAARADPGGVSNAGQIFIVYGGPGARPASFNLAALNGANGFSIVGGGSFQEIGHSAATGDINGDGRDDILIGYETGVGGGYVVFGRASGVGAELRLADLDGTNGFELLPATVGNSSTSSLGRTVAAADLNGDGFDDLVMPDGLADPDGRSNAGSVFVVYGKAGGFPADIDLDLLDGVIGFRINGGVAGDTVAEAASAGDVNGDGFEDLVLGGAQADPGGRANAGSVWVVFGRAEGFGTTLNLADLDGQNGFRLDGPAADNRVGEMVSRAGDVDGDGYDDLLIVSANGNTLQTAYLVYGKANGFAAQRTLGAGDVVFEVSGADTGPGSGFNYGIETAVGLGDIDGDGLSDMIFGAGRATPNGRTEAGAVFVVFGKTELTAGASSGADILSDAGGGGRISAGAGDDSLQGLGGNDRLLGGSGTDKALYAASAKDYAWWREDDGSWRVQDLRPNSPEGTDTLLGIEQLVFSDRTIKIAGATVGEQLGYAYENVMRASAQGAGIGFLNGLTAEVSSGAKTLTQAYGEIAQRADGTTAVAAMTYQFFLGYAPSKGGFDYLVSPTGPNPNNINSAYFQFFSQENRYINFAVSVGSLGDGKAGFTADYGSLTLRQATAKAYQEIFGGTAPNESFLNLLLDADVGNGMTRKDYFAYYGGDGLGGLGTKAAMVGWLLTEAAKADVGTYARSNNAYLQDLADGAPFLVDMVGVYSQPDWAHSPPG